MENGYIVLSEPQMEWMKKAAGQLMELTIYYGSQKQPLSDADYERITEVFSNQTKKSRGNALLIQYAGALLEYFGDIGSTPPKQPQLNKEELSAVSRYVEEQFTLTRKWQEQLSSVGHLEEAAREMEQLRGKFPDCKLTHELAKVFKKYLSFCMDEMQRAHTGEKETSGETEQLLEKQETVEEPLRARQRRGR